MAPTRMLSLVMLAASATSAASGALSAAHLKPDGGYAVPPDSPLRFQFAAVDSSERSGARMTRFRHWVRSADGALLNDRLVAGEDPTLELPPSALEPGRYRWGVQWWSADNETAEADSEVLVAPRADVWDGVPWLGAADANEFQFEVDAPTGSDAELLIATLGFGYVTVNGQEISEDVLSYSGWTVVEKRVLYRSYKVTHLLEGDGKAKIFVALGCGYRCDAKGQKRFPGHSVPAEDSVPKVFRLQLHVGGKLVAHSGSPGWQARRGPVLDDSVYDGENYDTTAATAWGPASPLPQGHGPQGTMVAASFPGVRITRVDAPVAISKPTPGVFVVDFGSNVAGVCNISIPAAASVALRHGEVLQHASMPGAPHPERGRVYFGNLRSAKATDTITTAGPLKDWRPRFTYHGFRYVEVTGFPGELTAGDISRLRMHTNVEIKSHADFGDETLQAIHEGSRGSQLSNLMQLPTDCPQRDERLGWMGDASLSAESMMLHFDYGAMAAAFTDSMIDAMGDDGNLTDIVPVDRFSPARPGDSSWTAAFIEILTQLWKVDGDLEPARARWSGVQRHVAFIEGQYKKLGSLKMWPEHYGDWCPPSQNPGDAGTHHHTSGEVASRGFSAAFSAANTVRQAADLAAALKMAEAASYSALASKMREDFHKSFYNADSKIYDKGFMVNYVLPLALGAVPPEEDEAVFQGLLGHIASKNNTWSGGIINNRFLFDLLHDRGHAELALSMLKRRDYPSYGYMYFNDLEPAKECMWELPDAPFQGDGMNSRNHHMYSSVGSYLVRRLAGLHRGEGARELRAFVGPKGLPSASARLLTPRGEASWAWRWSGESLSAEIHVPVGMHAQVHLPAELDLRAFGGRQWVPEQVTVGSSSLKRVTLHSGRHSLVAEPGADHELFV